MGDYSFTQLTSSSHFLGTLPSLFATSSTTPLSAFNSQQYYHPTMPSQVEQANFYGTQADYDDDEEDEDEPQLVRGGTDK
ncbi:hypothetical protein Lal_00018889 [Lupinus albus]|nr:hypothetical protein Lal_00018889 [Lupinus albus]